MPNYAYTARDLKGKRVSGTLSAASEREAISQLAGKSLFPLSVQLEKTRRRVVSTAASEWATDGHVVRPIVRIVTQWRAVVAFVGSLKEAIFQRESQSGTGRCPSSR